MPRLTKRAQHLLNVLRAEAADAPVQPTYALGPMDTILADTELERAGYIEVRESGYKLTPKGVQGYTED